MITSLLCKRFNRALEMFSQHPASSEHLFPLSNLLAYSLQEVCVKGHSTWAMQEGITVWYNEKNYKKYKTEFDKEFEEYPCCKTDEMERRLMQIHVPYKDFYGIPFKVDHCEYWGELSFSVFHSNDFEKYADIKNWQTYQGPSCHALSYEEMVIKLSKLFLKNYGTKLDNDFLTVKEKENHKKHHMFNFDRRTEDGRGSYLDRNPKYIYVNAAEINRRWLKEFIKTDFCKKNWKGSFDFLESGKV